MRSRTRRGTFPVLECVEVLNRDGIFQHGDVPISQILKETVKEVRLSP